MLKQLAGTVLRGVISDIFSEARREKVNEAATLFEGWNATTEATLKNSNSNDVKSNIEELEVTQSEYREGSKEWNAIQANLNSLNEHYSMLIDKNEQILEDAGIQGELKKHTAIANHFTLRNQYDVKGITEALDLLNNDIDIIEKGINEKDPSSPDDKLAIETLGALEGKRFALNNQLKVAQINEDFNKSYIDYNFKLDKLKTDPELYKSEGSKLMEELSSYVSDNSAFLSEQAKNRLTDEQEEFTTWLSGFEGLDTIEKWEKQQWTSSAAEDLLKSGKQELLVSMGANDKTGIRRAFGNIESAIRQEQSFRKQSDTFQRSQIKDFSRDVLSQISPIANKIDNKLGGKGANREIAVKRLPDDLTQQGGAYNPLVSTPSTLFDNFNIETAENAQYYKQSIGKEIAKFVSVSDINGAGFTEEEQKDIKNILGEGLSNTNVSTQDYDNLYKILSKANTPKGLDWFTNPFSDDIKNKEERYTNELYKDYLSLYKIIYDSDQRAKRGIFRSVYGNDLQDIRDVGSGTKYDAEFDALKKSVIP